MSWRAMVFDVMGAPMLRGVEEGSDGAWERRFTAAREALEQRTSADWNDPSGRHLACRLEACGSGEHRIVVLSAEPHVPWVNPRELTGRQFEVCQLAAVGATAHEVARHLQISPHTVRQHLKAAYAELGVANRVELAHALALL
ncbi:MAG: LuxR C-terminal-related transcriptional regulator [Sandaracinaceae bacterium]